MGKNDNCMSLSRISSVSPGRGIMLDKHISELYATRLCSSLRSHRIQVTLCPRHLFGLDKTLYAPVGPNSHSRSHCDAASRHRVDGLKRHGAQVKVDTDEGIEPGSEVLGEDNVSAALVHDSSFRVRGRKNFCKGNCAYSRRPLHGFTLVEMLVVIAIIGVLAALLMPALRNAMDAARRVPCMNNLKQMHLGIIIYLDMSKGTFPPGYHVTSYGAHHYWADILGPYFDPACMPSTVGGAASVGNQPKSGKYNSGWISYSRVMDCPSQENEGRYEYDINAQILGKRLNRFTNPSSTMILWDPGGELNEISTSPVVSGQMAYIAQKAPHNGGNNQLWGDGHVAWDPGAHYFLLWTWGSYWPFVPTATKWHPALQ